MGGVVPKHRWEYKADPRLDWTKPDLQDFTDKSWDGLTTEEKKDIAAHYAWTPKNPPDRFTDLKFPHHDPKTHAVVWGALRAAMARLPQSKLNVEEKKKIYNHIARHYKEDFNREPPEFKYEEGVIIDDKIYNQPHDNIESVYFENLLNDVKYEKRGELLVCEGKLIYPGTFKPLNGEPIEFTPDMIRDLYENSDTNIELYLTHFDRTPIGFVKAYKFDEETYTIYWEGAVYRKDKFAEIMERGFSKTSPEIDIVNWEITGIAFTRYPAIKESIVEEVGVIAMSEQPDVNDNTSATTEVTSSVTTNTTDTNVELDTSNLPTNVITMSEEESKEEEVDVEKLSFSEYLVHKGFSEKDIEVAMEKAKKELIPEWFSDINEEDYKEYVEWRENRVETLINEVKSLGFSRPEELLEFAKTTKEKIEILQKIKENLALSESVSEGGVDTNVNVASQEVSEAEKAKELCTKLGLDWNVIKDLYE